MNEYELINKTGKTRKMRGAIAYATKCPAMKPINKPPLVATTNTVFNVPRILRIADEKKKKKQYEKC